MDRSLSLGEREVAVRRHALVLLMVLLVECLGCAHQLKPAVGDVPELIALLKEGDDSARASAALALGKLGPGARAAVPALGAALRDEYEAVREQAAWALGQIGPDAKAAVPALRTALRDSMNSVRRAAGEALKTIDP